MRRISGLILATVMVLAACGDDGASTVPTLGTTTSTAGTETTATTTTASGTQGDLVLEALRAGCEAGDMALCDVLYLGTPLGSELEAFGDSCGERNDPAGWCVDIYDVDIDLEDLADECVGGNMLACDMLYLYSDFGSPEEALGDSCGGRGKTQSVCVTEHGMP